ncbi:hypothetical protein, partial [Saccharothrix hoggarensis]
RNQHSNLCLDDYNWVTTPVLDVAARLRAAGRPVEAAEPKAGAAVLLAGRGEREAADAALREALAGYDGLGAAHDVRRAEERVRRVRREASGEWSAG